MKFKLIESISLDEGKWYKISNNDLSKYLYTTSLEKAIQYRDLNFSGASVSELDSDFDILTVPETDVLTSVHRGLRRDAHKARKNDLNLDHYLIHHINGKEYDNSKENIIIVPYEEIGLKNAQYAHWALHLLNKENPSTGIPIKVWDGTDWVDKELKISI